MLRNRLGSVFAAQNKEFSIQDFMRDAVLQYQKFAKSSMGNEIADLSNLQAWPEDQARADIKEAHFAVVSPSKHFLTKIAGLLNDKKVDTTLSTDGNTSRLTVLKTGLSDLNYRNQHDMLFNLHKILQLEQKQIAANESKREEVFEPGKESSTPIIEL